MRTRSSDSWSVAEFEIVRRSTHSVVIRCWTETMGDEMVVGGHRSQSCSTDRNADTLVHTIIIIITTISSTAPQRMMQCDITDTQVDRSLNVC